MADSSTSPADKPHPVVTLNTGGLPGPTQPYPGSPSDSGSMPPPLPGSGMGTAAGGFRFQILRSYDSGGMGDLFVARDLELGREVIVKKIQGNAARNPEAVARFMAEAQITGLLEHPGIVPVYGFGRNLEGHVYYAMRLIQGVNLLKAINQFHDAKRPRARVQRELELRGLLRRFVDVCNAIGYAHNRGTLHRDIKPANIMLGPFGETLVIDWGLAKIVGRPETPAAAALKTVAPATGNSSATQIGQTIGTPMYMSPEQAAGLHDELTPASDVYSLGVTLYQLLTGKLPFVGFQGFRELLEQVKSGEFIRPRQANKEVPLALEAICLKAMARTATERYATAQALAEDLERWLADEPVAVLPEPWYARLGRHARKRQQAAGAAAALLLTTVLGLGIGFLVVRAQKIKTEEQRTAAVLAREEAQTAARAAEQSAAAEKEAKFKALQATAAEKMSRARADRRAELTLDTLKSLFLIQQDLENTPNSLRVREQLLTAAIEGMRDVARQNDADKQEADLLQAVLLHERTQVLKIGGHYDDAAKDWRTGHDIILRLYAAKPKDPILVHALAVSWSRGSGLALDAGDFAEALKAQKESLRLNEELVASGRDPKDRRNLAAARGQLGYIYLLENKLPEARPWLTKSLDLTDRLVQEDANDENLRRDQAITRERLSRAYLDDDLTQAREHATRGLAIVEKLEREHPRKYSSDLAVLLERTSDVQTQLGDGRAALAATDRQVQITQRQARTDPANAAWKLNLIVALRRRGELYRLGHDFPKARQDCQEAKKLAVELASVDAGNGPLMVEVSISCRDLAHVERLDGQFALAETLYAQAARELRQAAQRGPGPKAVEDLRDKIRRLEMWQTVCQQAPAAIKDLDSIKKQEDGEIASHLLELRVRWFARQGRHTEAEAAAQILLTAFRNAKSRLLVTTAACFALCAQAATENNDRDRDIAQSVDLLRKAVADGYKNLGVLGIDADYDALRDQKDFKALLDELKAKVLKSQP